MWNVEAISNPSQYCCLVWIGVYLVPMQRVITQSLTRHQEMMWDGTVVDDVTLLLLLLMLRPGDIVTAPVGSWRQINPDTAVHKANHSSVSGPRYSTL